MCLLVLSKANKQTVSASHHILYRLVAFLFRVITSDKSIRLYTLLLLNASDSLTHQHGAPLPSIPSIIKIDTPLHLPVRRGLAQHHNLLQRLGHQLGLVLHKEVRAPREDHLVVGCVCLCVSVCECVCV